MAAFGDGKYRDAHALALQTPSADHLAFAARSLLAEAVTLSGQTPPQHLLSEAKALAETALERTPNHNEARLQLAIALSLDARSQTPRKVWRSGIGNQARDLAEAVLQDDPKNSYAHGFLAVWHLEVRRRGGAFGASMMGASVKRARTHYQKAAALTPNDAALHWQYGRALTALNATKYSAEIEAALSLSQASSPRTALEALMQMRAQDLRALIRDAGTRHAESYAAASL